MRLTLLLCAPLIALAGALPINDYSAKYDVYWRGLYAGELRHELRSEADNYTFVQRSKPAFPLIPFNSDEKATFAWNKDRVVPLTYNNRSQEGSRHKAEAWTFHWDNMTIASENTTLRLEPRAYDPLTQSVAMRVSLLKGEPQYQYKVLYKGALADWPFEVIGEENIMTTKGSVRTIKFSQNRGKYITYFWLAPAHQYLLMRFEKVRKDRVELAAQIMDFS